MQCPRCGEWAVYLQYGRHACLACPWTQPAEWALDRVAIEHAERRDN